MSEKNTQAEAPSTEGLLKRASRALMIAEGALIEVSPCAEEGCRQHQTDIMRIAEEECAAVRVLIETTLATQPTQAQAPSVTTSQTVDDLIADDERERERAAEWQQWVERGGYDGGQQAEVPSVAALFKEAAKNIYHADDNGLSAWERRNVRELSMMLKAFKAALATQQADESKERVTKEMWKDAALNTLELARSFATQQAGQGEAVAFEFYNPATGHAIVDYSRQTHVGPLTKEMGYEARPLGYVNPPPAAVKPSDPVPLWQALEALDSLEESSRGDAPYNHFAAGLVRSALEQTATPPAPQQPEALAQRERDREDAENGDTLWLWKNGDHFLAFKHLYPCFSPGGDPMTLGEPFARAEFRASYDRAARSSEGGQS